LGYSLALAVASLTEVFIFSVLVSWGKLERKATVAIGR
jgi:hypothetical protein